MNLTPELEQFVAEAVAAGRYRDVAELMQAGVSLLRDVEAARAVFEESLDAAQAEGERDGFVTAEDAHRRMSALLDEISHAEV